jgi:hypothetical protein
MGKKRKRMNEYRRKVRKRNKTEFFMNGERKKEERMAETDRGEGKEEEEVR